jgi:hypothetical protein
MVASTTIQLHEIERTKKAKQGAKHLVRTNYALKQLYVQRYWETNANNPSITVTDCYAMQKSETPKMCSVRNYRRIINELTKPELPREEDRQVVYGCSYCVDKQIDPGTGNCPHEKKKNRAEYEADIYDLKVQLANTQKELERARNKVDRYQQWARQAPWM